MRPDPREKISEVECIAYVATILPELKAMAASEPELQRAIEAAETVAMDAVARLEGTARWREAGLSAPTSS